MKISIVTIVKGRQAALHNLIQAIRHSELLPAELVVVHMNEKPYKLPELPIPIRQYECHSNDHLPLAKARNLAMQMASSSHVIFLDVDCMPSQTLVNRYSTVFSERDVLWSGRVNYLGQEAMEDTRLWENMAALSEPDPVRGGLSTYSYELFWSLNFGCSKGVFDTIGGFDEAFTGYGAEDTDFAFKARQAGVPLATVAATAYHQYHSSYSPPLNHFEDIVKNAEKFREKWRHWPMEGWLNQFEQMGLLEFGEEKLTIIRNPNEAEIAAALRH